MVGNEAFWRQVPVGAYALGSQLQVLILGSLAETEVSDLDSALMEEDVLGLEVVVDHLIRQFMQVANGTHDLS